MDVPIAAPLVPNAGIGPSPRMRTMLRMTLSTVITMPSTIGVRASPAERSAPPSMKKISMPLLNTNSSEMSTEGQRLLDKYKNAVVRADVTLKQRSDEVMALQLGVELNDLVSVRAETRDFSPGIDDKFWVEGIEHQIDRNGRFETVLHLEEM